MRLDTTRLHVTIGFMISLSLAAMSGILGCGGGGGGSGGVRAWIESDPASAGESTEARLMISNPAGVAGLDFDLAFDASSVSVSSVTKTTVTRNFSIVYNDQRAGSLAVSMANATGLTAGTGELLQITFRVDSGVPPGSYVPLSVDSLRVYNSIPADIALREVSDGEIYVQ